MRYGDHRQLGIYQFDILWRDNVIRTKGVLHFTISVSNPDASEKFYQDVLGLQTIQNVRPTGMVFMKSSDDFVILTKSETPVRPNLDDNFNVHHAFVVDVDQYEIAKQHVIDCGIKIIFEEERREGVFHGRQFYFHDPDRNVLEIIALEQIADGFELEKLENPEFSPFSE